MAPSRGSFGRLSFIALLLTLLITAEALISKSTESEVREELFCGTSLLQGYREAMEDRASCVQPIAIPLFLSCQVGSSSTLKNRARAQMSADVQSVENPEVWGGKFGQLSVRAFAVFDGHGGSEASVFATSRIRPTLKAELQAVFAQDKTLCSLRESGMPSHELLFRKALSPAGTRILESVSKALEKALLRLDDEFEAYAVSEGIDAGTTACVAVLVEDRWLQVANIGDSRATLCSVAPPSGCATRCPSHPRQLRRKKQNVGLCARDLTSDHRFERTDELERVRRSGGVVLAVNGVPRLMGVSMLSRAIGDVDLKPYGMVPDPELTGWIDAGASDVRFLVLASDGVYEDIPGGQCVCDLVASMGDGLGVYEKGGRQPAIPLGPSGLQSGGWETVGSETGLSGVAPPGKKKNANDGRDGLEDRERSGPSSQQPKKDGDALLPAEIAERLRDAAFHSGSMDNIAVVVVDLLSLSAAAKRNASPSMATGESAPDPERPADSNASIARDDVSMPEGDVGDTESSAGGPHARGRPADVSGPVEGEGTSTSLAEAGGFKVYISGQVVYGEGSEWCYQLVEVVSSLPALPAPNPKTLAVLSDARPPHDQALGLASSSPIFTGPVHTEPGHSEPIRTKPLPREAVRRDLLPTCSPSEAPIRTCEESVHTPSDLHPVPLGLQRSEVESALPQSPSAWATRLELYHRHLVAPADTNWKPSGSFESSQDLKGLGGLGTFLDVVASVPIEPAGWTEVRPAWRRASGESTGEEVGEEWTPAGVQREEGDHRYRYVLRDNFAKGSFGEVWRAVRMQDNVEGHGRRCRASDMRRTPADSDLEESKNCRGDEGTVFILKRLLVEKGGEVRLSGLREKFFGELFSNASATWHHEQTTAHAEPSRESGRGSAQTLETKEGYAHLVRYMDSFEMHSGRELWLVFRDEGKSLRDWMYDSPVPSDGRSGLGVVAPSAWWRWLRTDARGRQEMKSILWQLLAALRACHQHDVTHRDVKPANLLLVTRPAHGASDPSDWQQASNLSLRLNDFGSAWSPAAHHLYGAQGPSRLEETPEYSPPEALFAQEPWLPRRPEKAAKYDMWSAGVLFLELLLGTPHVFQVSARTRVLLERHLAGCRDATCKELAYVLRAFLELCIYPPAPMAPLFPQGTKGERTVEKGEASPEGGSNHLPRVARWLGALSQFVSKLSRGKLGLGASTSKSTGSERGRGGALAWQCSEESFLSQLRARDPLGGEAEIDIWGVRLLRRLLHWNPKERVSAEEALQHAFFRKGPPGGFKCAACGREFESSAQCLAHSKTDHLSETAPPHHCM